MVRTSIEKAIQAALAELGAEDVSFVVERPSDMSHGDYATNAALVAAKSLKANPREIAQSLTEKLPTIEGVKNIEVAGAGFINFSLSPEVLTDIVGEATEEGWGKNSLYLGQHVLVEYTDPNPFKEFHIGHLMSNAIGESIARLFEAGGADVKRANYQGDVGVHVAKAIWAKRQKPEMSWGEAYVYGSAEYETNKEEIDELNKTIYEKSDVEVNKLYEQGRNQSLDHFEGIYKTLGTKFDYYFFESETGVLGLDLVDKHPEVFERSDGATIFRGENVGLHTRVFINSKGLPTYEAKELGLVVAKKKQGQFDLSLTVTANETRDFFRVVRAAAEKIFPDLEDKMLTRFHGFLKLTTGKMSSRLGNVITGESLIRDLTEEARGREDVAVGAIKFMVLRQNTGKDIIFDPEKSLSLEGDSGPYVQYALVRTRSLLREAKKAVIADRVNSEAVRQPGGASELTRSALTRLLVHFPDVVARASMELEPHHVATYLTELASSFNSWYASERLIVDGEVSSDALALVRAVEHTLDRGLNILGIPAPQEM
ncbi:arginine--tRNA ligase [Candidatus Adlerbacteria bacterium RIFOXYC1_FULL_48_26]|uniref:Arginine--tRNA ligase n=1 Tax=Candidatus Adlerbacteria bacterium RIFOXYC1_FULL_48_26 TaxID=1797247 RepID=A0A1F4Y2E6_9BACT|nr:MAG: arginine--tRNA ligase [Candidatus Adlerbacteria bacterium RIFOXYC1_FULL_48_26]OGC94421.1 MAG: arginine--tRNA ligase [Candidatus Adlerbacteria bacterium RIFOXYB1_FULL_48_10]OGC94824.1 MAG: arginine--tRNA ligase [Candidatus Adlerbacteria bacterium RIFOXYD1_FULL_48_8]